MRVILLKEVKTLGLAGDIKEVAAGYARNFLIPSGLAKVPTPAAIQAAKAQAKKIAQKSQQELDKTQAQASKLEGQAIEIKVKATEGGTLFAGLSSQKIATALKVKGFNIKKNQIRIPRPIKELGEYELTVNLIHGLEARFTLIVGAA